MDHKPNDLFLIFKSFGSYSQTANIIFLDQPVGSGFSYSKTPIERTSDTSEVKKIHEFLQKVIKQS